VTAAPRSRSSSRSIDLCRRTCPAHARTASTRLESARERRFLWILLLLTLLSAPSLACRRATGFFLFTFFISSIISASPARALAGFLLAAFFAVLFVFCLCRSVGQNSCVLRHGLRLQASLLGPPQPASFSPIFPFGFLVHKFFFFVFFVADLRIGIAHGQSIPAAACLPATIAGEKTIRRLRQF